jgi:hypothetical protein
LLRSKHLVLFFKVNSPDVDLENFNIEEQWQMAPISVSKAIFVPISAFKYFFFTKTQVSRNLVSITRSDWTIKKGNMPLFSPLGNMKFYGRDKSGDESACHKARLQRRIVRADQIPLFSPCTSRRQTQIFDRQIKDIKEVFCSE